MEILEALRSLDVNDGSRWTDNGLPRIEFVSELVGRVVTRREITEAAPLFTRLSPVLPELKGIPDDAPPPDPDGDDRPDILVDPPPPPPEEEKPGGPSDESVENQKNIQAWIERQHLNRIERAQRRSAVLAQLNPNDLAARSPLDEAMTRRTRRGTTRPDFLGLGPQSRA